MVVVAHTQGLKRGVSTQAESYNTEYTIMARTTRNIPTFQWLLPGGLPSGVLHSHPIVKPIPGWVRQSFAIEKPIVLEIKVVRTPCPHSGMIRPVPH